MKRNGINSQVGALLVVAAVVAMISAPVRAEVVPGEPITLEQATKMALHADPRIEEQRANVARAQALIERVEGEGGPRVSANLFAGVAPKAEDGIFTNGTNSCSKEEGCTLRDDGNELDEGFTITGGLSASIIQPLYTFGKLENYGDAARLNRDVKASEVALARGETWLTVRRAYWGYLAARDTRQMLEGVKRQVARARDDMREDAEAGEVPMSELYALESGVAQLDRYLAEAGSVESIAIDGLKTIIGVPIDASIEVAESAISPVDLPAAELAELADRALAHRPEMAMAENGQAAMRNYV
ncbi:MAG: TolC family protein, partial [Guyparkeria sp.]